VRGIYSASVPYISWVIWRNNDTRLIEYWDGVGGVVSSSYILNDTNYHLYTHTWDSAGNNTLYIDGNYLLSVPGIVRPEPDDFPVYNNFYFSVSGIAYGGISAWIDDIAEWNYTLSISQIQSLMAEPPYSVGETITATVDEPVPGANQSIYAGNDTFIWLTGLSNSNTTLLIDMWVYNDTTEYDHTGIGHITNGTFTNVYELGSGIVNAGETWRAVIYLSDGNLDNGNKTIEWTVLAPYVPPVPPTPTGSTTGAIIYDLLDATGSGLSIFINAIAVSIAPLLIFLGMVMVVLVIGYAIADVVKKGINRK
jgi:hypothetical protein